MISFPFLSCFLLIVVPSCQSFSLPTLLPSLKSPSITTTAPTITSSNPVIDDSCEATFTIQKVSLSKVEEFRDITNICIDVFFNDGALTGGGNNRSNNMPLTPWKSVQLSYLRHAQYSDLRTRKFMGTTKNEMFIARKVHPTSDASLPNVIPSKKITEGGDDDAPQLFNLPLEPSEYYIPGDIIGFCEVTARMFGLPGCADKNKTLRPLITNLAVRPDARRYGVGSRLVDACETIVQTPEWRLNNDGGGYDEIILQVEDDNDLAKQFYAKRGYDVVFKDATTRRYDTSGFFLRQVRSTKVCMRKELTRKKTGKDARDNIDDLNSMLGEKFMRVFRGVVRGD